MLTVKMMENNQEYSGDKEVLVSVASPRTGVVVSEKGVHDAFKEIHCQFIETKSPRLGTVDIRFKKTLKGKHNVSCGHPFYPFFSKFLSVISLSFFDVPLASRYLCLPN